MALPHHDYGDPLSILERREARTCKGCALEAVVFDRRCCSENKKHGRRCNRYKEGMTMLRRVRKEEIVKPVWLQPDALDMCLSCWRDWMSENDRDLECKTMRLAGGGEYAEADLYEAQRAQDLRIGMATGAMVDGLKNIHQWALKRACGLATVWHFPNADYLAELEQAREQLRVRLKTNICTRTLF